MCKILPKVSTIFFIAVFILQLFLLPLLFFNIDLAKASDVKFNPQISVPGSEFIHSEAEDGGVPVSGSTATIGKYISAIYQYGIGIVAILATVVLMFGGVIWLTAGGDMNKVNSAKEWIKASLTGLIIALCSYVILLTINPDLVNFRIRTIKEVNPVNNNISDGNGNEVENYDAYISETSQRLKSESDYTPMLAIIGNGDELLKNAQASSDYEQFKLPDGTLLDNVYRNIKEDYLYSFYSDVKQWGDPFVGVEKWIKK